MAAKNTPKSVNGVSSELFDSLKVYLNTKSRLQPIIGLGSVIECVKTGSHQREARYLCEVCVCLLSKNDMRNHIVGSLHRYNYIKARHPHFASQLKENSDLSLLARPLMEMAKMLEEKEGPGEVKILVIEDAVYQKMARHSDSDALTLINCLRRGQQQSDPERRSDSPSAQPEHDTIQSQRIVILVQDCQRQSDKSFNADSKSLRTSTLINKPPSLIQSNIAFSISSEGWLDNLSSSHLENTQTSDNSSSFLAGYTGTKPLIGLFSVVECKSEDGHTHCFLCHCCRIRSNKNNIIDHLTSNSHLINYLMVSRPEQVEDLSNNQLLQSLAEKVQQQEGQGKLEVVIAPESLCILMTGKSYHWCTKMLYNGGTQNNIQNREIPAKEQIVNKPFNQVIPEKHGVGTPKLAKWKTLRKGVKAKKRIGTTTVFKVSLPIARGSILLERTTFSKDSLPASSASTDSDLRPSPETQTEECESDCNSGSFAINHSQITSVCPPSQLQQDFVESGQYVRPERNATLPQYHGEQSIAYIQNQQACEEMNYEERWKNNFSREWQHDGQLPAVSGSQEWDNSTSQNYVGSTLNAPGYVIPSNGNKQYYQQQPIIQYTAQDPTRHPLGGAGHRGLPGELAPHLDAAGINVHLHIEDSQFYSGRTAPELQYTEMEQRPFHTYMCLAQTCSQVYPTQPPVNQATHVHHMVMPNPSHSIGPRTNPDQLSPYPVYEGVDVSLYHSNAFIQPGQAQVYQAHFD